MDIRFGWLSLMGFQWQEYCKPDRLSLLYGVLEFRRHVRRNLIYVFSESMIPLMLVWSYVTAPLMAQAGQRGQVKEMFDLSHQAIIVIAHRGCHEPAPAHHFGPAPENSFLALEHCVAMGVDMMETDVRRTADGHLIIMHDDQVNRTTDGRGNVEDFTLEEIRRLRLRQNLGGYAEPLTYEHVPTLDELLAAAKGKIALNLDVKGPIYAEVIDAILSAGASEFVTVKAPAAIASPRLAAIQPYTGVPFIPILDGRGGDLILVAEKQLEGASPIAIELPRMLSTDLAKLTTAAKRHGRKVTVNTLGDGSLSERPGDNALYGNADEVWGWPYSKGVTAFQTDLAEALVEFRDKQKIDSDNTLPPP